ncbi:uncharacterized protein LOC143301599 [Babylonia areolata]|uniref:uncharacterized protein LOC143301599 n=1 Tax=Babylonia areolata TaxID=304850 RepID=UPI003FD0E95F
MTHYQGPSSSSGSDRIVIDLEFCSEGNTGNEGAASTATETDVETHSSPTKRVGSPSLSSEHGGELLAAEDNDLLDDIFHRSERFETDGNMSTNDDRDDVCVSQDESNPFDVQEVDSGDDNSGNDDSDSESRLVIEERQDDEQEPASDRAVIDGNVEKGERETVLQAVISSPEHRAQDGGEEECCEKEDASERGTCSLDHSETMEEEETEEEKGVLKNLTGSPVHSESTGEDMGDENEAVSQKATSSPEQSFQYELSETFLDNLNPQDASQDVEEDQEEGEGDMQRAAEKEMKNADDALEKQTCSSEHSDHFEMSETFLDNLNPQDESQDLEEGTCDSDNEQVVKDANRDRAASSPDRLKRIPVDEASSHVPEQLSQDEASPPCAQPVTSTGESSLPLFQDPSTPASHVQQDTSVCEASSTPAQMDSCADEASSPSAVYDTGIDEICSADDIPQDCPEENICTDSMGHSDDKPQVPAEKNTSMDKTCSSCVHQDALPCEASSSGDETSSPQAQLNTSEDAADHSNSDDLGAEEMMIEDKERAEVQDHNSQAASPAHEQNITAGGDTVEHTSEDEECNGATQNTIPEEASSPDADSVAVTDQESPAEENTAAEEAASPSARGESDRKPEDVASFQDVKDSTGKDRTAALSSSEEKEALSMSAGRDDDEYSFKDDDVREEGEYSSSPSPQSEPGENEDDDASDVLQLSADDVEKWDEDSHSKKRERAEGGRSDDSSSLREKLSNRDPVPQSQSSPSCHRRNSDDDSHSAPVMEVSSDKEENDNSKNRQDNGKLENGEENSNEDGEEDGIDIMETSVDLDDKDDNATPGLTSVETSSKGSPALGVTRVIQRGGGEKDGGEGDSKTLQANDDDDSDDDVQIIEVPPQEPIDTLIVDDDDDDDIVPSSSVTSKAPVSESSRTSKKKRTVEQDGHDLRIVIRDERREKEDSDRHHRRHEKERRDERRSDSHRRSESDRKSSDRSSRRRHHRSRSHSRERRRKRSRSRSYSRERTSRRRRHRDRSRDKSADRERSSHRKRRRDRSRERRRRSHSRSRSPKRSREDSWDKENRDERESAEHSRSKKRCYHRDDDKGRESPEKEKSSSKQDSPLPEPQKSSQKQSQSWKPSDTLLEDPSDSPSTLQSAGGGKSDNESEGSVEEVMQNSPLRDNKSDHQGVEVVCEKAAEVIPVDIPVPEPQDIPIPKPEDIPIPETENIPVPQPLNIPVPQPVLVPELAPVPVVLQPHPFFENPPLPPVPEEEPMENPPEPPPLPPRWPEVLPSKGEGLLPTPIRRKAALEEAAAVYDPAHPTDDDGERFMYPGMPNSAHPPPAHPPPEMMGGPPPPPRLMGEGPFVVPAPGEGGLLGPPPQRIPMQPVRFGHPPRPMMVNHVVMDRPPFSNGPFPPSQPPGPPMPPRFRMEMGGPPGSVMPPQFGQGMPPPGPPHPPPQGFPPGQMKERFEDGPPFPVSAHSGMPPDMGNMGPPPPGPLPPPDMHMMSHPPPQDMVAMQDGTIGGEDKTMAGLVVAPNMLSVMNNDHHHHHHGSKKDGGELGSVFKVPLPPGEHHTKSPSNQFHMDGADLSEDSTEVMDMDMSPLEEECELQLTTPPEGKEAEKRLKPLVAIDLKAISNAIKKLASAATDDVPASAVELTNKEKYMKKLHLQERVVDEVKQALRPFYSHKKIDKEEYKTILRKAVPKVCHSRSGDINPQKIQQLVEGYVSKFQKQRQFTEQKVKPPPVKPAAPPKEKGKANGERTKPAR